MSMIKKVVMLVCCFSVIVFGGENDALEPQDRVVNKWWTRVFYAASKVALSQGDFVAHHSGNNGFAWYEVFVGHQEVTGPHVIAGALSGKYANLDAAAKGLRERLDGPGVRAQKGSC